MALRRKPTPPARPTAILGSAMRFDFGGAQTWSTIPTGDRRWQAEAWAQFDICGELRYAVGWKGNAMAQATLYAADVDAHTGRPTGPTENATVQAITDSVLGGPVKRPQHVYTIAVNLDIAGEVWIVVLSGKDGNEDEWLVVSSTEMNIQGRSAEITHPKSGATVRLGGEDLLFRIWKPHPRLQLNADSAVRALLPTLREIENTSKNIAARLDSRLASAGILKVPTEADFATGDDDPEGPTGLSEQIAMTMRASLRDAGSAGSQVPIILQADRENLAAIEHISLETEVTKEVVDLREKAIGRLAAGMDLPREVLEGMGDSNHWSAWQVEEATYKTHLLPLLDLISDSLTTSYLIPALEAANVPSPETYMLAFDGSSLIGEPDPLAEALELYDRGIITDEAVRTITSTPDEYAPQGDERLRSLAERLVLAAPTLIQDPEIRRLLGFTETAAPVPALPSAAADTPGPADTGNLPARTVTAGFQAASLSVKYALERAGNRLLNTQRLKDEFSNIPRHELHVKLRPDLDRHGDLLADAWRHDPMLAQRFDLERYTRALIAVGAAHTDDNLREWLARHD